MDSIKWKCKNWIVYFKKLDNFHLFHLVVEKLDMFNFYSIFSIVITNFTIRWRFEHVFFKNTSKVEILQRRQQDFEIFNILFNILDFLIGVL